MGKNRLEHGLALEGNEQLLAAADALAAVGQDAYTENMLRMFAEIELEPLPGQASGPPHIFPGDEGDRIKGDVILGLMMNQANTAASEASRAAAGGLLALLQG